MPRLNKTLKGLPMTTILRDRQVWSTCSDDQFRKCYLSYWNYHLSYSDIKRKRKLYKELSTDPEFKKRQKEVIKRKIENVKSPFKPHPLLKPRKFEYNPPPPKTTSIRGTLREKDTTEWDSQDNNDYLMLSDASKHSVDYNTPYSQDEAF